MHQLSYSVVESFSALGRIGPGQESTFGAGITAAYQLERGRATLEILRSIFALPSKGEAWLHEYGEQVRLFRNRVDHYDEDLLQYADFKSQIESTFGDFIQGAGEGAVLRVQGKGKWFELRVGPATLALREVFLELVALGYYQWDTQL